jgi:hypothetical protein
MRDGRTRNYGAILVGDGKLEIFFWGKFTALTGHRLPGSSPTIGDGQAALEALVAELCPATPALPAAPLPELNLDDQAVIERVRRMDKGRRLYDDGDLSLYDGDHSRADQALLNCFRSCGVSDPGQFDRLFQASALNRDKWKDREDYRRRTIATALDGTVVPFDWSQGATSTELRAGTTARPIAANAAADAMPDACTQRVAELERQLAEAHAIIAERDATIVALTQTILNPHLTHTEKVGAVNIARHADAKRRGGQVESDGRVVLSPSEVSDDWRPKPKAGEHIAPVNPDSGTPPHMPRSSARSVLDAALDRELIRGEKRGTVRHRDDGSTYTDWDYVVSPAESFADLLNPWAKWRPDQPKTRKLRESHACPACGEVHPIKRIDYCMGCGTQVGEPKTITPEPPPTEHVPMGEKFSPIGQPPLSSPTVAERRSGRKFFSDGAESDSSTPDPWDAPPDSPTDASPQLVPLFPLEEPSQSGSYHWAGD